MLFHPIYRQTSKTFAFTLLNGIPVRNVETREGCLDHFIVKEHHKTVTIKTFSNHFPVSLLLQDWSKIIHLKKLRNGIITKT